MCAAAAPPALLGGRRGGQSYETEQQPQMVPEEYYDSYYHYSSLLGGLPAFGPYFETRRASYVDVPEEEKEEEEALDIRYINLAKRKERRWSLCARLRAAGISRFKRFEARTGAEAPDNVVTRYWDSRLNSCYDKTTLPHPRVPMTPGERGCAASHAYLWARCARRPDAEKPMVILEDDVEFAPNFKAILMKAIEKVEATYAPADRCLLLYLGADVAAWSPPRNKPAHKKHLQNEAHAFFHGATNIRSVRLLSADYLWQTSSYVVWPAAAKALLSNLPIAEPVDNYISRQILTGTVKARVCVPFLCRQVSAYCDGDILHSRPLVASDRDDGPPAHILGWPRN